MPIDSDPKGLLVREFQLNGFVVLRGFLPRELVDQMHEALMPLLETEHRKAVEGDWKQGRSPGRLALHLEQYVRLLPGSLGDPRFSANPDIEELVDAVLGAGEWTRGWTTVECCWKGSHYMDWHSDQLHDHTPAPDAANETIRVTYNIPLVDFTWQTGAMELLPCSHRVPRDWGGIDGIANIYPHKLRLERGDAVLRDGNIFHRGTPNLSDEPRPMLDQTYLKYAGNVVKGT